MIVLKHILVATDFSDASGAALVYGRELARCYRATLHVLHAVDDLRWRYAPDMPAAVLGDAQSDLEATARERVETLLSEGDRTQLQARPVAKVAMSASTAIVDYARSEPIDLIVIGSHGRGGGVTHLVMGSVAERVVRTAPCPVLTVRTKERDFVKPDAVAAGPPVGAR